MAGVRDHDGVRRHLRRARQGAQLARHCGGQGQGGPRRATSRACIDAAKAVAIPMDREVLHVLPQEYVVDDQDGIREPLGMAGVRLEAQGPHRDRGGRRRRRTSSSAQPLRPAGRRHRARVARVAEAVLDDDEKELGVALIDIGGGTMRPGDLHRRRDRPHLGARRRRPPPHQRHRDRAAHAARPRPRRSSASTAARCRDGRRGRDDGSAVGRRPCRRA